MPEGSPSEIGRISVGVEADTSRLTSGLASAEQQTRRAATSMFGSFGRIGRAVSTAASGFRAAVRAITGLIGAFAGLVSIASLVVMAITKIYEYFDRTRKEAERLEKALDVRASFQASLQAMREFGLELSDQEKALRSLANMRAQMMEMLIKAREDEIISRKEAVQLGAVVMREYAEAEKRVIENAAKQRDKELRERYEKMLEEAQRFQAELEQGLMSEEERHTRNVTRILGLLRQVEEINDPTMIREAERIRQRILYLEEERRKREAAERAAEVEEMAEAIRQAIEDGMREAVRDMIQQWRSVAGAQTIIGDIRALSWKLDLIRGQMPRGPFTH